MNHCCFNTPLGLITIGYKSGLLYSLSFASVVSCQRACTPFERMVEEMVQSYLRGNRRDITLSFSIDALKGTEFQKRVWSALCDISYGERKTYGDIAKMIGNPRSAQAVGNACGANPLPLLIPCHRVVAQNSIGGFSAGLKVKEALLTLEGGGTIL